MGGAHLSIDSVIELGLKLSGVNESPYYGVRALKLNGRMPACTPVNRSAEVNSAVVAMGFEQRDALLKRHPLLYYITDHYAPHPTVLVRLSRMTPATRHELHSLRTVAASLQRPTRRNAGCSSRVSSSTHPAPPIKMGLESRPIFIGGEGGIRTHGDGDREQ